MPDTFASVSRSLSSHFYLFIYFETFDRLLKKWTENQLSFEEASVDTHFPRIFVFTSRFIHFMFILNLLPRSQKEKTKMTSGCQIEQ